MFCEGGVEGLLEAEPGAVGVNPVELRLAEAGTHLVQAVLAVARIGCWPRYSRPVQKGLCGPVQHAGPVPVAHVSGETCQAEAVAGQTSRLPFRRLIRRHASNMDRAVRVALLAQHPAQVVLRGGGAFLADRPRGSRRLFGEPGRRGCPRPAA